VAEERHGLGPSSEISLVVVAVTQRRLMGDKGAIEKASHANNATKKSRRNALMSTEEQGYLNYGR
jgi:hypothetical protein